MVDGNKKTQALLGTYCCGTITSFEVKTLSGGSCEVVTTGTVIVGGRV